MRGRNVIEGFITHAFQLGNTRPLSSFGLTIPCLPAIVTVSDVSASCQTNAIQAEMCFTDETSPRIDFAYLAHLTIFKDQEPSHASKTLRDTVKHPVRILCQHRRWLSAFTRHLTSAIARVNLFFQRSFCVRSLRACICYDST